MIESLLVAWLLPLVIGGLCLSLFARPRDGSGAALFAGLSFGLGLGGLASVFFLWLHGPGPRFEGFWLAAFGLALVFVILFFRKLRPFPWQAATLQPPRNFGSWLLVTALLFLAAATLLFLMELKREPHGGFDAWAFWNMRARFLFRAGEHWRDAFSKYTTHNRYPLLLPSAIVQAWNALGKEPLAVAKWIAAGYAIATLLTLGGALSLLRGKAQGLLGIIFLLSQPFFASHAASLYAEIPLGFYFLATFVLLALYDEKGENRRWLLLAGMAAGMAAWTKGEGMLFVMALGGAKLILLLTQKGRKDFWPVALTFGAGLLPWFFLILYFRLNLPEAATWSSTGPAEGASFLDQTLTPLRHWLILKNYAQELFSATSFTYFSPFLLLLLYAACCRRQRSGASSYLAMPAITLLLLFAGYYAAYLFSPHDLIWHLQFSLDRLLLQAWPSMVFVALRALPSPEFAWHSPHK